MKTNLFTLIALVCLVFTVSGQEAQQNFQKNLYERNQINQVPKTYQELLNCTFDYYLKDLEALKVDHKYYNNVVLNNHFKNIVTSFASNISDLSFNTYFLETSTDKKNITLGGSFRLENISSYFNCEEKKAVKAIRPLQKLQNIFTVSLQANVADNFAKIFNDPDDANSLNNNINLGLKFTHVRNGSISADSKKVKLLRTEFVKDEVEALIELYTLEKYLKEVKLQNYDSENQTPVTESKTIVRKKFLEYYKAIVDSELKYAKAKDVITSSSVGWFDLEARLPITKSKVDYLNGLIENEAFFEDYKFSTSYSHLCSNQNFSTKLSGKASLFHTNNFIANSESQVTLNNLSIIAPNVIIVGETSSYFNLPYNEFWAQSLQGDATVLFFNNRIGLSSSLTVINYNGDFVEDSLSANWKLGIPVSLKDKEGKPTVNFELQWKEVNKEHVVGIGIGYNFGNFIK